jgi:hypothetical protein
MSLLVWALSDTTLGAEVVSSAMVVGGGAGGLGGSAAGAGVIGWKGMAT